MKVEEIEWDNRPMIGLALRMNIYRDYFGEVINVHKYYQVGKHTPTGQIIVIPDDKVLKRIKKRALNAEFNKYLMAEFRLN